MSLVSLPFYQTFFFFLRAETPGSHPIQPSEQKLLPCNRRLTPIPRLVCNSRNFPWWSGARWGLWRSLNICPVYLPVGFIWLAFWILYAYCLVWLIVSNMFTRLILLLTSLNSSAFILLRSHFIYIETAANEAHSSVTLLIYRLITYLSLLNIFSTLVFLWALYANWPLQLLNLYTVHTYYLKLSVHFKNQYCEKFPHLHFLHIAGDWCVLPNSRTLSLPSSVRSGSVRHPISPLLLAGCTRRLLSRRFVSISLNRHPRATLAGLLISDGTVAPGPSAVLAAALQLVDHLLEALELLHGFLQQPELFGQLDGEGRQSELVGAVLVLRSGPGAPALTSWSQLDGAGGSAGGVRSHRVRSLRIPPLVRVDGQVHRLAGVWHQGGCEKETGTNAKKNSPHLSEIWSLDKCSYEPPCTLNSKTGACSTECVCVWMRSCECSGRLWVEERMCARSLQGGESAGEVLLPQIAVSLISAREREGGCWVRERGGAALLRNVKHRSSGERLGIHTNCGSKEGRKNGWVGHFSAVSARCNLFLNLPCVSSLWVIHSSGKWAKFHCTLDIMHAWTSTV